MRFSLIRWAPPWAVVFLIVVFTGLWIGNLQYRKLIGPDEGRYAEIAREMALSGDWVTPKLNDLKYLEKPPLQYWVTAAVFSVFGEEHWTARFWPALTGFLGVFLVAWTAAQLFGPLAGWASSSVLGGSLWYVAMAHLNTLDMGLTFCLTWALCAFLLAQRQQTAEKTRCAMLLAWVGIAFAVLSKGVIGLVIPGMSLLLYSLFFWDWRLWQRLHLGKGMLLLLLIVSPWFIAAAWRNPEFLYFFFVHEHLQRFATEAHRREGPWYYFLVVLVAGLLPWTSVWLRTLPSWKEKLWGNRQAARGFDPEGFLMVWVLFIISFFSISQSKLPSYVLPIFPALALLMGRQMVVLPATAIRRWLGPVYLLGALLIAIAWHIEVLVDDPDSMAFYLNYRLWIVATAVVLTFGAWLARFWLRRDNKKRAFLVMGFAGLLGVQVAVTGHEVFSFGSSSYHLVKAIEVKEGPWQPEWPFFAVRTYDQTLPFYLKRPLTLVKYYDEMTLGLEAEPEKGIPKIEKWLEIWQGLEQGYALLKPEKYEALVEQGVPMRLLGRDTRRVIVARR